MFFLFPYPPHAQTGEKRSSCGLNKDSEYTFPAHRVLRISPKQIARFALLQKAQSDSYERNMATALLALSAPHTNNNPNLWYTSDYKIVNHKAGHLCR